jgi:hypothetical protein
MTSTLGAAAQWPESESIFELALVYEDPRTRGLALQVTDSLALTLGIGALHAVGWKISDINQSGALAEVVRATSLADVIVTSLYAAEHLPPEFYVWVDAWLPRRPQVKGTFLGLVAVPADAEALGDRTENYLRAVARRGDLECLIHRCELNAETPAVLPLNTQAGGFLSLSDEIYDHWGLNE